MAPILNKSKQKKVNMFLTLLIAIDLQTQYEWLLLKIEEVAHTER